MQHDELAFGAAMIMLGTIADDAYRGDCRQCRHARRQVGLCRGRRSRRLFAKAKAAGVTIEEEPTDRSYGSREFIVHDPGGNVWAFGTYWPKAGEPA